MLLNEINYSSRAIAEDLETYIAHVGVSLTSYFIGISVGQLIYGPLIDRFGGKTPLLVGLLIYVVAAVGSASALLGSFQMIAGALASALVSYFHNGTAMPMVVAMAVCSTIGFIILLSHQIGLRKSVLASAQN